MFTKKPYITAKKPFFQSHRKNRLFVRNIDIKRVLAKKNLIVITKNCPLCRIVDIKRVMISENNFFIAITKNVGYSVLGGILQEL